MHRRHEPARLVRADRHQRQIGRAKPVANPAKQRLVIARIADEPNRPSGIFGSGFSIFNRTERDAPRENVAGRTDSRMIVRLIRKSGPKSSPKPVIARGAQPIRPVLGRRKRDLHPRHRSMRLPPIQLDDPARIRRQKQVMVPQRRNELGIEPPRQPPQRVEVEMVVVIVTDAHDVDGRQRLEREGTGWTRRGPTRRNGLTRSENTGSNSRFPAAVWTRKEACPSHVATMRSPAGGGGGGGDASVTRRGHAAGRDVKRHRRKSRNPRSGWAPGWKNVFPLKWSDASGVIGAQVSL